jgi:BirA family biotin operon repressor/biotin-[acetyl-CoA-carboxylase] ligase
VEVLPQTASTNAVVAARSGEPAGLVVVAEEQTAGRGRLDRVWQSPPRAGLTFSVLLDPPAPVSWLPLWGGLAVARALRELAGLDAVVKWPNDVLVDGRKLCGLLAEVAGDRVVLGIGLNVTTRVDELPRPDATSVALAGATTTDRDTLLRGVLRSLGAVLAEQPYDGYRALCSTIGTVVRVTLPGDQVVSGVAEAVDDQGRLVVAGMAYAVGDVVHAGPRPVEGP